MEQMSALGVQKESPSTRRAWIEMLRIDERGLWGRSPSTRRAWIEIGRLFFYSRTGGSRPPPGGRG